MSAERTGLITLRRTSPRTRSPRQVARGYRAALEGLESRLLLSNTIERFLVPRSDASLDVSGGITLGSDGGLWFLVGDSPNRQPTAIERFDPATHAYTSFPFADAVPEGLSEPVDPTELVSGPDGNIWFTLPFTARIGRFDIKTDAFTLFTTPTAASGPDFITAGPDDALWFTEEANNQIGRIDATTGAITEYVVPQPTDLPPDVGVNYLFQGITAGADGGIWFTEPSTAQIGRIDPATKAITELDIPGNASALTIIAGPDGNLWFAVATGMGEVDLANDTVATYAAPNGLAAPGVPFSSALSMVVGSDGGIWINNYHSFDIMDDIRFDPRTKAFSAVESNGQQGDEQMQLAAGPGAIMYGLDVGQNTDGDGHQPQSIDAVIPTVETTTQLSASPSGTDLGQYVTFTAVVGPTNPIPGIAPLDGSVTLLVDGQVAQPYGEDEPVQLQLVNGQYVATFQLYDLTVGTHDVVASYGGTAPPYTSYAASDSADLAYTVGVFPTHTIIQEYPETADPGQPVSFQAIVGDTSPNGNVVPDQFDGSIIFTVDGVPQPSIPLSLNGDDESAATLTLTSLGSGSHFVTAAYGGSATFGPSSTAQPAEVTITGAALISTTTTLTASPSTADLGQAVTFTAGVAASGQGPPTGDVTFAIDGVAQAPAVLSVVDGQDVVTLTLDSLTKGVHVVTAVYGGDASFAASSSGAVDVSINPPTLAATTTTILASPTTGDPGRPVTFSAIVDPQDPTVDVGGLTGESVLFTIDGGAMTSVPLELVGRQEVARLTTSSLSAGDHVVTAIYNGDSRFSASSSSPFDLPINEGGIPTATSLTGSPGTVDVGQAVTFNAAVFLQNLVETSGSTPALSGQVVFTIDGQASAPIALEVGARQMFATFATSTLAAGTHTATASFLGHFPYGPSDSRSVEVTVNAPITSPTASPTPTPTTPTPTPATSTSGQPPIRVAGPAAATEGPRVMDLQRFGYHSQPTVLVLTFDQALSAATASDPANYTIVPVGPHGKVGHAIAIKRLAYDASARTVTIHPSRQLNVHDEFELIVDGTSSHAVSDESLLALDGRKTGGAGSNYVGEIDWRTIAGPSLPGARYARGWRKLVANGTVRP